jgi:hypothetical protein
MISTRSINVEFFMYIAYFKDAQVFKHFENGAGEPATHMACNK